MLISLTLQSNLSIPVERNFWKLGRRLGEKQKKGKDRSNRTRQNNRSADRKVESNDSPEIPDWGKDVKRVGLLSGQNTEEFKGGF